MPHFPILRSTLTPARRLAASVVGAILLTLAAPSLPAQTYYDAGESTPQEQQLLWLMNRARQDPTAEGVRVAGYMRAHRIAVDGAGHGPDQVAADFAGYPARPPLAMNKALLAAARAHSADMAAHGVLTHVGSDGSQAEGRDAAAGYTGAGGWETAGEWVSIEELHYGYMIEPNNLAHDTNPLGHRNILLDLLTGVLAEVGVGLAPAAPLNYETTDFGVVLSNGTAFLVGTVYQDGNANGSYDPGEGVAGVRVSVDGGAFYTVTGAAGGYAVPMVRASDGKPLDGGVSVHLVGMPDGERRATLQVLRRSPLPGNNYEYYGPYRSNVALDARVGDGTGVPVEVATVGVTATMATASPTAKGKFVFTRTSTDTTNDLNVNYTVGGTALGGTDYKSLPGVVTILAGQSASTVKVKALPTAVWDATVKVKLTGGAYRKDPVAKAAIVTLVAQ